MKTIYKLIALLFAGLATFLVGCSDNDHDQENPDQENPEEAYAIVGTWTGGDEYATAVLKFNKDGKVRCDAIQNGSKSSYTGSWEYRPNQKEWYINGIDGYFTGSYYIIGDELFRTINSKLVFKKDGDSGDSKDDGIYAGKDFVGKWQGTDGDEVFLIELAADGTYTDWLVQNGSAKYEEKGKYTVTGNTLIPPSGCNLVSSWGDKPYTIKFSGKNKMTIANKLMTDYNQELVLNRK